MIPQGSRLPHEREQSKKDWKEDKEHSEFSSVDDELTQRWVETHYPVRYIDSGIDEKK